MLARITDAALGLTIRAMQWLFRGGSTLPAPGPGVKQPVRQGADQDAELNQRKLMQYHELAQACTGLQHLRYSNMSRLRAASRTCECVTS